MNCSYTRRFVLVMLLWLFICPTRGETRTVLLELFVSDSVSCLDCGYAEEAVRQLQNDDSLKELHVIVYHLNDDLEHFTGLLRSMQYGISNETLPTAFFNGLTRVQGANETIKQAYQSKIDVLKRGSEQAITQAWIHRSNKRLTVSAWVTMLEAIPLHDVALFFAITETFGDSSLPVVRHFDSSLGLLRSHPNPIIKVMDADSSINETQSKVMWILQNQVSKEILASWSSQAKFSLWDANRDGVWSSHDLFMLLPAWNTRKTDLTGDGIFNRADLPLMLSPHPSNTNKQ